ncbi:MAG: hypothetical protein RIC14_14315 [Filomicrobium sp.]
MRRVSFHGICDDVLGSSAGAPNHLFLLVERMEIKDVRNGVVRVQAFVLEKLAFMRAFSPFWPILDVGVWCTHSASVNKSLQIHFVGTDENASQFRRRWVIDHQGSMERHHGR